MANRFAGGIVEKHAFDRSRTYVAATGGVSGGNVLTTNATPGECKPAGASDQPKGVALHDAAAGETVTVVLNGQLPLIADGSINAGDACVVAAAGAVSADTSPDMTLLVGYAASDAADTEEVFVEVNLP